RRRARRPRGHRVRVQDGQARRGRHRRRREAPGGHDGARAAAREWRAERRCRRRAGRGDLSRAPSRGRHPAQRRPGAVRTRSRGVIARLRGRLDAVEDGHAVIDVGGVGYLVACSARTLANLPRPGEAVDLLIETQVRDDAITLYGFPGAAERRWFRLLLTVQGVGARVALGIHAVLGPDELARAVAAQDKPALARANGVGPRLAGRIASERRERLG